MTPDETIAALEKQWRELSNDLRAKKHKLTDQELTSLGDELMRMIHRWRALIAARASQ